MYGSDDVPEPLDTNSSGSAVGVAVAVGVSVGVAVGVTVAVAVGVSVAVAVAVGVAVSVGVAVGAGARTVTSVRLDSGLWSAVQMLPCALQLLLAGRMTHTSAPASGVIVISHRSLRPSTPRAPVTEPPVKIRA